MGQPQITPGSGGYLSPMAQNGSYADNPWQVEDVSSQINQGGQNLQQMAGQAQNYAQQTQPYPTFQNSMGLGSQSAFGGGGGSAPSAPMPDSGSRGFNPWSLQGEALSR